MTWKESRIKLPPGGLRAGTRSNIKRPRAAKSSVYEIVTNGGRLVIDEVLAKELVVRVDGAPVTVAILRVGTLDKAISDGG